jgi:dTDP-4-amino-4,6-dideoxygalactose transaminase
LRYGVLTVPARSLDKAHVFNNYVVRVERRDELKQFLAENGIQSEIYYPVPLHLQRCFAGLGYRRGEFPQAELAASRVLALPLYPELTQAQQELVVETIRAFYHR